MSASYTLANPFSPTAANRLPSSDSFKAVSLAFAGNSTRCRSVSRELSSRIRNTLSLFTITNRVSSSEQILNSES